MVGREGLLTFTWKAVRAEESSSVNGCDPHYRFPLYVGTAVGSTEVGPAKIQEA